VFWFLRNAWLIPALPTASFVIILLLGRRFPRKGSEVGITAVAVSFGLAVLTAIAWFRRPVAGTGDLRLRPYVTNNLFTWFDWSRRTVDSSGHAGLAPGEASGVTVSVAGRLMLRREMGKLAFGVLRDSSGAIQLFAGARWTPDFDAFTHLSLGDWIGATGEVVRTKTGELSVRVTDWTLLAEARRHFTAALERFERAGDEEGIAKVHSNLGVVAYREADALQQRLCEARKADEADTPLLLEHPPVITPGRRGSASDVYLAEDELRRRGISLARTTRGGLVTYHGPGQLVGYPIVGLRARGLTVPCYVRAVELAVVDALGKLDIAAHLDDDHIGVWTSGGKIAAIGVAQRHGVTLHGFAVNLQPKLEHFALINPCGIGDLGVTSAEALLGHPVDLEIFKVTVAQALAERLTGPG